MIKKEELKDLIKNNWVDFSYFRAGYLYYQIVADLLDGQTYVFPVPISDIGEATFSKTEKAIFMMRYIRKAIEDGTLVPHN